MNYIIVENERIARENMVEMCRIIRPEWNLVATLEGVADTMDFLTENQDNVDLAIFDIELVDGNCFEIFRKIDIDFPVIFTTAYEEYLLKAFKVNSIDYILKPITLSSLKAAFDKYDKLYGKPKERIDSGIYQQLLATLQQHTNTAFCSRILTNGGDNYGYVNIDDVALFVSEDKYVFVITFDGKKLFTTYLSLNDIENDVDPKRFFRLSRSTVANIEAIVSVSKYFGGRLAVIVKPQTLSERIIVSSARRRQFLQWLGGGTV